MAIARLAQLLAFACAATSGALARPAVALTPFPLVDTVWAWHASVAPGGARTSVDVPDRYTIELLPDGTARVRADCNRGQTRYQADDVSLRFGAISATKVGCPSGSRDREFLAALARVERYRFEGIELVLLASSEDGALRFKPARS